MGWSLQHEVAFYVLAALVVPTLGVGGLAAALAASSVAGMLLDLPWYLENLALYHPCFLAGVLAFTVRNHVRWFGAPLLIAAGFAFLALASQFLGRHYYPIGLFVALCGFVSIQSASPIMKPMAALGDASYSIYLTHTIVFYGAIVVVSRIGPLPLWSQEVIRLACFVVIIAVSLLTWRWLEKPMIQLGNMLVIPVARLRPAPSAMRIT